MRDSTIFELYFIIVCSYHANLLISFNDKSFRGSFLIESTCNCSSRFIELLQLGKLGYMGKISMN